jgi:hypothetical protein
MLIHPDDALLVRWSDGEAGDEPGLANHLATCRSCAARLAELADEAAAWRAELALTPVELTFLSQARLPDRLEAVLLQERRQAAEQNRWHLLALLGLVVGVALTWALLDPIVEPVRPWLARLFNPVGLLFTAGANGAGFLAAELTSNPLIPLGVLLSEILGVIAALLLVGLWAYRPRPAATRAAS